MPDEVVVFLTVGSECLPASLGDIFGEVDGPMSAHHLTGALEVGMAVLVGV